MSLAALVKRYSDYRVKNAQIKVRQKIERETELRPFLAEIGREVYLAREQGHKVTHMADEVTNKNRNFLYDALRAHEEDNVVEVPTPAPAPKAEPSGWVEPRYVIETGGEVVNGQELVTVEFYGTVGHGEAEAEEIDLCLTDGIVENYPDEWVAAKGDEKAFYKRIVQEVEREAAKGKPQR